MAQASEQQLIAALDIGSSKVSALIVTPGEDGRLTVLGTGQRGDGPEPDPRRCSLSRPHGVLVDGRGVLYVGDSEAHRIRTVA